MNNVFPLALISFLFAIGAGFNAWNVWCNDKILLSDAVNSRNWPTSKAYIKNSFVDAQNFTVPTSQYRRTTKTDYAVILNYEYKVGGRRFAGNRITLLSDNSTSSRANAIALANRFQEGKMYPVYYNPKAPGEAVLVPGIDSRTTALTSWWWVLAAVFFASLFLFSPLAALKFRDRRDPFGVTPAAIPAILVTAWCALQQPAFIDHMAATCIAAQSPQAALPVQPVEPLQTNVKPAPTHQTAKPQLSGKSHEVVSSHRRER